MIIRTRDINIAKFYGYRREDIEQWLDESEYHLQTRDIIPNQRTALKQLIMHFVRQEQEYIQALPSE